MAGTISNIEKRGRGRPRTEATPIMLRLQPDQLAALDAWIAAQPNPRPSRPEAVRTILKEKLEGEKA